MTPSYNGGARTHFCLHKGACLRARLRSEPRPSGSRLVGIVKSLFGSGFAGLGSRVLIHSTPHVTDRILPALPVQPGDTDPRAAERFYAEWTRQHRRPNRGRPAVLRTRAPLSDSTRLPNAEEYESRHLNARAASRHGFAPPCYRVAPRAGQQELVSGTFFPAKGQIGTRSPSGHASE